MRAVCWNRLCSLHNGFVTFSTRICLGASWAASTTSVDWLHQARPRLCCVRFGSVGLASLVLGAGSVRFGFRPRVDLVDLESSWSRPGVDLGSRPGVDVV